MSLNFKPNTLFTRDNLPILRGMNSETVDLIYLDPPFNSKKNYQAPLPIKDAEISASFKDVWKLTDIDTALFEELKENDPCLYEIIRGVEDAHSEGMFSYLLYMAIRLKEMKRVLKSTGSIYLHCDPTASHYLKIIMDCIFKVKNFRNEIVWCYRGGGVPKSDFAKKHDILLRYSKDKTVVFNVDAVRIPYSPESKARLQYTAKAFRGESVYENYTMHEKGKHPEDWWVMQPIMPSSKERTGYPTQKPLPLLERILQASSNEGDLVLDPFCGCATAIIAAEKLQRKWIGIDASPFARFFVKDRMKRELEKVTTMHFLKSISGRTDIKGEELKKWQAKKLLYEEQEKRCNGCEAYYHEKDLTVDHIIPRAKGGQDTKENLQLLCFHCNTVKGVGSNKTLKHKLRLAGILDEEDEASASVGKNHGLL